MQSVKLLFASTHGSGTSMRRRLRGIMLWAVFSAGLLVQLLSPRLRSENNSFVIPAPSEPNVSLSPADIVAREKQLQAASALLTLAGALGLGWHYRRDLGIGSSH